MLAEAKAIYLATRKRHDQLFNSYIMRPLAAVAVAIVAPTRVTPNQLTLLSVVVFACAAALLVILPGHRGALIAIGVLELSYLLDCADGMLARHKKIASQAGHLFDFFTDELKAVLLVCGLSLRLWRTGGYGIDAKPWPPDSAGFLIGGLACVAVVASAVSLTNFVRRPELSGRETPIEAHYEAEPEASALGVKKFLKIPVTFLQFLNHYPSHVYLFAAFGRLDLFLWIYLANNALYLARGWLSLFVRFGRFD
jgi:hypothetical protein